MNRDLRPYQANAIDALRASIGQGVRRIVLQGPTGMGKTRVAAEIALGAQRKGKRMAFVVPALSLIDQTVQAFWDDGIKDIGVIQREHQMTDWSKPIQICSIQTLAARGGKWPEAAVVVFDECHLVFKAHLKWMADPAWQNVPFIGVSATPWARGMGKHYQSLIVVATTAELIEQKYLSPFRVFAVSAPDLSNVRVVAGDYVEKDLSGVMCEGGKLTADIVETWKQRWGKDKTFVFAVDCAHARQLHARFLEAGITAAYQDGETPIPERNQIKKDFHKGDVRVLVSVGTISVGADYDVRCISYCRPTKSEMFFQQAIGRGLRTGDGKDDLLILDHASATVSMGFPTDIDARHDHLDDGERKKAEPQQRETPLPKPCPSCGFLAQKRESKCSNCGHEMPRRISTITERNGQLVEIKPGGDRLALKGGKAPPPSYDELLTWYAELKWLAQDFNYAPGWAAHSFKDRFGYWPPRDMKYVQPREAGIRVRQWVKSRMIARAKARRKGGVNGRESEIRMG